MEHHRKVELPAPSSLIEPLKEEHADMVWVTGYHVVSKNGETIADSIRRGRAIAVTNGSFKEDLGTAAYVVKGDDVTNQLIVVNQSPGHSANQSSFRSELLGYNRFL